MKLFTSASLVSLILAAQNALAGPIDPNKIPEPGVWALMGVGVAAFAARQFMKKR